MDGEAYVSIGTLDNTSAFPSSLFRCLDKTQPRAVEPSSGSQVIPKWARPGLQGNFVHEKVPSPKTFVGPPSWTYCRILRGGGSYERATPVAGLRPHISEQVFAASVLAAAKISLQFRESTVIATFSGHCLTPRAHTRCQPSVPYHGTPHDYFPKRLQGYPTQKAPPSPSPRTISGL